MVNGANGVSVLCSVNCLVGYSSCFITPHSFKPQAPPYCYFFSKALSAVLICCKLLTVMTLLLCVECCPWGYLSPHLCTVRPRDNTKSTATQHVYVAAFNQGGENL